MRRFQFPTAKRPDTGAIGVARALFLPASIIAGGFAVGAALAESTSQSDGAMQQMREECAKMQEEMQSGSTASTMDDEAISPEMKEMHEMCATMKHGSGGHEHHGEAQP